MHLLYLYINFIFNRILSDVKYHIYQTIWFHGTYLNLSLSNLCFCNQIKYWIIYLNVNFEVEDIESWFLFGYSFRNSIFEETDFPAWENTIH